MYIKLTCMGWCILHSVVFGVLQAFQNKLMNMNLFWVHTAPSQSPTPTVHASQLPPPSHWCSSAIFTCKYPGRWVGSWCGQLGNINYICMWFEGNRGLSGSCYAGITSQKRALIALSLLSLKYLFVLWRTDFEVSLTLIISFFALRLSNFLCCQSSIKLMQSKSTMQYILTYRIIMFLFWKKSF